MKYRVLLKFLQVLVYIKRFFWRIGSGLYYILGGVVGVFTRLILYIRLRIGFFLKRIGITQSNEWVLKRDFIQIIVFFVLLYLTYGQSKIAGKSDLSYVGQRTLAYELLGGSDEFEIEEVVAPSRPMGPSSYSWKTGAISLGEIHPGEISEEQYFLGTVIAGGSALSRPTLMPGTIAASSRTDVTDYQIEPGDSLSSIAYEFGVSVETVMWENNLSLRSILKPGMVLKIPPVTGVMHTVKKGDTLKKIASTYNAKPEEIIAFNHLKENGTDMKVGERIVVPNGSKQTIIAVAPTKKPIVTQSSVRRPAPPNSLALPSVSGFVWPTGSHIITQYYGLTHHALDIGGAWQTPIYATKSGTVAVSQCGWNSGYGCYIIIDHGDGIRSLYGHNSQLLVSVGDYVETGQTIALMGNTGKVRGVTGIHSHFEIQVKGARVNPLKYVR